MAITLPWSNINTTLNQINLVFQQIAEEHAQINAYGWGQLYEIGADTIINYPLLWVWPQPSKLGDQTIVYSFKVIMCDLVKAEGTSVQQDEVQSDMPNVLWDISMLLRDRYDFAIDFPISITPFTENFNDRVTGWMADMVLTIPQQYGICDVPEKQ